MLRSATTAKVAFSAPLVEGFGGPAPVVASFSLFASFALNTISAILVPRASQDDSLSLAGVRVADLLVVVAIVSALLSGVPRGGYLIWGTVSVWIGWTALAALGVTSEEFSLYRGLAEWQFAVYLVACWLVFNLLSISQQHAWSRKAVRAHVALLVLGCIWCAVQGSAGADFATIGCVIAMFTLAIREISTWERLAAIIPAVTVVAISGQRAAILLSLIPVFAAIGLWIFKLGTKRISQWLTGLVIVLLVSLPSALAVRLDASFRQDVADYISRTFFREAKQLSVESRYVQWSVAWADLSESPILGQGVGGTVLRYLDPGVDLAARTNITHNSALDFGLRFGSPIGFLLIASFVVLVATRVTWAWRSRDYGLWICAWALGALLAKGMVESVFFKPRLIPALAILVCVLLLWPNKGGSRRQIDRRAPIGI